MVRALTLGVALAAAAFHLYAAGVAPFTALVQRPVHLGLMAVLGFLGVGIARADSGDGEASEEESHAAVVAPPTRASWLSWLLVILTVAVCAYLV
ncbi:MAG: hypothetical protein OEZ37_08600, partial [Gemmatimonadota bacterium]|nr:hypothetical protein [Gemmatimonadota bacterium]